MTTLTIHDLELAVLRKLEQAVSAGDDVKAEEIKKVLANLRELFAEDLQDSKQK